MSATQTTTTATTTTTTRNTSLSQSDIIYQCLIYAYWQIVDKTAAASFYLIPTSSQIIQIMLFDNGFTTVKCSSNTGIYFTDDHFRHDG